MALWKKLFSNLSYWESTFAQTLEFVKNCHVRQNLFPGKSFWRAGQLHSCAIVGRKSKKKKHSNTSNNLIACVDKIVSQLLVIPSKRIVSISDLRRTRKMEDEKEQQTKAVTWLHLLLLANFASFFSFAGRFHLIVCCCCTWLAAFQIGLLPQKCFVPLYGRSFTLSHHFPSELFPEPDKWSRKSCTQSLLCQLSRSRSGSFVFPFAPQKSYETYSRWKKFFPRVWVSRTKGAEWMVCGNTS